ncbi:carboxylesterase family protein [Sphingomonas sp. BN140010]|uniref:Carboxylic ester hydrolase n=2 Tax=Sphingomonas arvum TaxID=2992113 RepID=A0ABT3JEY6_9SPHN|nr:carboxylesterase family protein [Sphingomonas sp. BN140010]
MNKDLNAPEIDAIRTAGGLVRGSLERGVRRFLGIHYAAPPVGANRFREPVPVLPWEGVRDAIMPGPSAPYKIRPFPQLDVVPLVGNSGEQGGDYLRLNIWAPENARNLPVMLFIHGGGFVLGSKDSAAHDGTALARAGVVSVAINYRLNIDGFLPVPGIPTNLGLRDMIAALRWVRDNIAAFGGDPDNVTLFGESAGAMATANLVTSPLAKGLFRRAIVQSGHGSMVREIPVARRLVSKLAKLLKISPDAEGFASVPFDRVWAAMEKAGKPIGGADLRDADGYEPVYGISRFIPVYGDDVLPELPLRALEKGAGKDVDLLIGTNAEEMNLYFVPTGIRRRIPGLLASWLLGRSNPHARAALKAYGLGSGKRPGEAMTEAMNDLVFRWPARQFAVAHSGRTHVYEMDWRSPASNGELGACHGIELPFVFNTLSTVTGPRGLAGENPPQELADRVQSLWVSFARDGSLPWAEFDVEGRQVYQLDAAKAVTEPVMPAAAFTPR